MPTLTIGKTKLPYQVRFSSRARNKRIVVKPEETVVIVPKGTPGDGPDGITSYVHSKRRWIFDAVREIAAKQTKLLTQFYASGAKLQYRGRWLMLDVQDAQIDQVKISCQSKFHVKVPKQLEGTARLEAVRQAFDHWLRARATKDLGIFYRRHASNQDLQAKGYRLSEAKHAWGTCGKDKIIRIHWGLIQAPMVAMEYVVAHELCHLIHRNHSPVFWRELGRLMPGWPEAKELLERWEGEHRAV
jgi:predicted metal-dependent hydrolase